MNARERRTSRSAGRRMPKIKKFSESGPFTSLHPEAQGTLRGWTAYRKLRSTAGLTTDVLTSRRRHHATALCFGHMRTLRHLRTGIAEPRGEDGARPARAGYRQRDQPAGRPVQHRPDPEGLGGLPGGEGVRGQGLSLGCRSQLGQGPEDRREDDQRQVRLACPEAQAIVPERFREASMPGAGERLLRMEGRRRTSSRILSTTPLAIC